jgi:hypothetical protein
MDQSNTIYYRALPRVHNLQNDNLPLRHEADMTQRRPIACTICAKAKTKCDKAVSGSSDPDWSLNYGIM